MANLTTFTRPYSTDAHQRIGSTVGLQYAAIATPKGATASIQLDIISSNITMDETWSPHIQGTLVCAVPDTATLALLDPRLPIQVDVGAGYVYPNPGGGATYDSQPLADLLWLRTRPVVHPDNTMTLTVASAECFAQDYAKQSVNYNPPKTGALEAVKFLVNTAMDFVLPPPYASYITNLPAGYQASMLADFEMQVGQTMWDAISEICDRCGVRVYVDSAGYWHVETLAPSTEVRHTLTDGPLGNIIGTEGTLSRDTWYNHVVLDYEWRDSAGTDRRVIGAWKIPSGDHRPEYAGYKTYFEARGTPVSQAAATAAAAKLGKALATLGRARTVTAISALWLRPGHRVQVTLDGAGVNELMTIRNINFEYPSGRMTLQLRLPDEIAT